ncbi:MAG: hypothetical protein ABI651_11455 [Verrucomicrobiota bacterium]
MKRPPKPLDLTKLRVYPLAERRSLTRVEDILIDPDAAPSLLDDTQGKMIRECARAIASARLRGASVMLIYGAHLIRNGAAFILERMMLRDWITHLATNGAGTIHDWEYAFLGRSTESVEENVATGTFGSWDETGRNIHLALLAGGLNQEGYGRALGRFISEDGVNLPSAKEIEKDLQADPAHPLAPAKADLLQAIRTHGLLPGRQEVRHPWRHASVVAEAFRQQIPLTVHPGIGYDIISNHPMFNGAVIGRAAQMDFRLFGAAVDNLDGGVVLSIGSAIMGPQVFEKSLSCVNNLRLQDGRPIVRDHSIYVVDLQDGGNWDWSKGEPPKTNSAYYLRFCKSFSRMGGKMRYLQCDNAAFVHHLYHELNRSRFFQTSPGS